MMIYKVFQFDWEVNLMVWIQTNIVNNQFMISVCKLLTYFGEPVFDVIVIGIFYYGINKKFGKNLGVNILASSVCNPLIKNLFFRIRPYFVNENIKCLKPVDESGDIYDIFAQGYSFPSGHTMTATALFGTFAIYVKKKIGYLIATVLVFLVAFSRFALGVHYPTDVIVGALVGSLVVLAYTLLRKKYSLNKIALCSVFIFGIGLFYCKTNDYFQTYSLFTGFTLACIFEEKYVNFKNTNNKLKIVLRIVFGALIFLTINKGLKLPFSKEFLDSGSFLSNSITVLRYGLGVFMAMGIFPMTFKYNIFKLDDKIKDGE